MDSNAFYAAISKFSAKFSDALEKGKSVVSSPASAEFVLALLTLGSTDPAHSELLTALEFPDDDYIRSSFSGVSSKIKALKSVTFNVANKIYIKDGPYELQPPLEDDAVKVFDASIEKLDFKTGLEAAAMINQWVDNKTNNKIKGLLSPESIDCDTRVILINVVYFKGKWKTRFDRVETRERTFHIDRNTTVKKRMMNKLRECLYGNSSELQAQLLDMPFIGEEASMLVILPHEIEGLQGVLSRLASGYDLMSEVDKMFKTKVLVTIPKFNIESEINLTEVLPKLGIQSIFKSKDSGLTKILNTEEPLFVSKAIQKACIEVNEDGAEAVAATLFSLYRVKFKKKSQQRPIRFMADRPFIVLILIKGLPYFMTMYRH